MRKPVRSPTTHAFHESLRYACKTRTKLHVPAFSNRSDSEAPAMETRYIRFASDYICNRDGLSFRGALITGLDPPRLLAFVSLPPFLSRRSSFNAPLVDRLTIFRPDFHWYSPSKTLVGMAISTSTRSEIRSRTKIFLRIFSFSAISLMNFLLQLKIIKIIITISFFFGI